MTDVNPRTIRTIDRLVDKLFNTELRRKSIDERFKQNKAVLERRHAAALQALNDREAAIGRGIWQIIAANRDRLIATGRRSFVTMTAKFQLRTTPARTEILDKQGIMDTARRLGVVKQIADPPKMEWRFNQKKFLAWLAKHDEYRDDFEAHFDEVDADESLTAQPNSNYTVSFNNKRLTPPSITIKKS